MTSAPSLDLPPIIAGRYLPVRLIAKGGMGAVYEVEHAHTGEHLALKVLLSGVGASASSLERFKREARASARINSDHVVRVIDADVAPELEGATFLVMELLDGMDLERQTKAAQPAPSTVVGWLQQVAVAIDKAHRLGIVHRDLKPENIFLTRAREDKPAMIKVLDFGIVKMSDDAAGATKTGQILGTPRYMAPEQVEDGGRVTSAADRYALGLVAYRLLTGESYYRGATLSVLVQILEGPLRPPSERHPALGGAFDAWFARACHRVPDQRFASAGQQMLALSDALGVATLDASASIALTPSRPHSVTDAATTAPRRRLVGLAVGAVAVAAAIAGMVAVRRPSAAAPPSRTEPVPSTAPVVPPASRSPTAAPVPAAPAPASPVAAPEAQVRNRAKRQRGTTPSQEPATPPAPDPYADQK